MDGLQENSDALFSEVEKVVTGFFNDHQNAPREFFTEEKKTELRNKAFSIPGCEIALKHSLDEIMIIATTEMSNLADDAFENSKMMKRAMDLDLAGGLHEHFDTLWRRNMSRD